MQPDPAGGIRVVRLEQEGAALEGRRGIAEADPPVVFDDFNRPVFQDETVHDGLGPEERQRGGFDVKVQGRIEAEFHGRRTSRRSWAERTAARARSRDLAPSRKGMRVSPPPRMA